MVQKQDGLIFPRILYFNVCVVSNPNFRDDDSNAALAAMLITVGIKLAHPKSLFIRFKLVKEQLAIFFSNDFLYIIRRFTYWYFVGMVLKSSSI